MTTMQELLRSIGTQLKIERNKAKVSMGTHCKGSTESVANYCNFENGKRTMSLKKLIELADGHNCDVAVMLVSKELKDGGWGNVNSYS